MTDNVRSYHEMRRFPTHEERYDYLKLRASVGQSTFGFDRWINQQFYRSTQWKHVRSEVIARDLGLDMGVEGFEIFDKVIIHHMNPMKAEDIDGEDPDILNPEYLITVSHNTHNAIHFGDKTMLVQPLVERRPGDTTLWGPRIP
jgi:hypothetical protein